MLIKSPVLAITIPRILFTWSIGSGRILSLWKVLVTVRLSNILLAFELCINAVSPETAGSLTKWPTETSCLNLLCNCSNTCDSRTERLLRPKKSLLAETLSVGSLSNLV